MKARVLFGVVGFAFVLLALYVFPSIVLEIAIAALCVLATYEVLGSTKLVHNRLELLLCMLVALGLAVGHVTGLPVSLSAVVQGLVFVMLVGSFAIELKFHDSMNVSQVAWGFFGALIVPYLMLSLLRIYQMDFQPILDTDFRAGQFIVLLPLLAAWGADTCALFSGMFFGKHKLAPVVSPKKTVEGAVGGVIGGAVLVVLAALLMNVFLDLDMPLWSAAVLGAVGAVLGEIGDLSFSVIKRQTGIKDYGHIFPGHGGVLDRFDSVLFVAPFAEILFRILWQGSAL
ncbi:phosphatidate cytidylyltransferase [Agathobaculum sp. Marseille-P7918]|uniref:phosphatidate cytidylyltransferase n=1 Tax=Agathobaculum sp. Marseille-P7918 TaxID=2479843 RepID=UPI000F62E350|nr:phosphatidate cytidylyltransferase [Agathobaculum sp. Marseille-P7918]